MLAISLTLLATSAKSAVDHHHHHQHTTTTTTKAKSAVIGANASLLPKEAIGGNFSLVPRECQEWFSARGNLTICRWFPTTCARCKDADARRGLNAVRMQRAIHAWALLPVCAALLCLASWRWWRSLDGAEQQQPVHGPHAAGWPRFTVELLQLYVAAQLTLEVGAFQAPESCAMQLPEFVSGGGQLWTPLWNHRYTKSSARFEAARWLLLAAWLCFLCLPPRYRRASTCCFLAGVAPYSMLAVLNLTSDKSHTNQPLSLFVGAAALAMPFLGGRDAASDIAGRWLTQFLALCVLASGYLAAGLSKIRYAGVTAVLNGDWLHFALTGGTSGIRQRSPCPWLLDLVIALDQHVPLLSWGAMAFELLLPALVLVLPAPLRAKYCGYVHLAFVASAIGFHAFNFAILGANFMSNCMLLGVLGAALLPQVRAGLSQSLAFEAAEPDAGRREGACSVSSSLAWAGSLLTLLCLLGWAASNADADSKYEIGAALGLPRPAGKGIDRMFPFSVFPMYTERRTRISPRGLAASHAVLLVITSLQLLSAALQYSGHCKLVWRRRADWEARLLPQTDTHPS
mmetsp:Transcript_9123/g.28903  ORF Transcript_9123/g.28903 Transcript_9123/m.28903 type:complete len:571 (+) Transcript_9123:53-1765(+)